MEDITAVEILIAEKNSGDAELIIRALRKNNLANNIYVAEDGADALDFFFCRGKFEGRSFGNPPKFVLLALKLPKISGLEIIRLVKQDKRTRHIPVVVVTSSREETDRKMAYELGVNSYVLKPVGYDQFINAISSVGLYWSLVNEH